VVERWNRKKGTGLIRPDDDDYVCFFFGGRNLVLEDEGRRLLRANVADGAVVSFCVAAAAATAAEKNRGKQTQASDILI
jgi:hypothetical protein